VYYYGDTIKKNEMGWICRMCGRVEKHMQILIENVEFEKYETGFTTFVGKRCGLRSWVPVALCFGHSWDLKKGRYSYFFSS
jgi:hypothetical protein